MADTNLATDWNFKSEHVQPSIGFPGQDYVSSESIVLCAAPPPWTIGMREEGLPGYGYDTIHLRPIGLVSGVTLQQNKQVQNLNEIGSRLLFTVPGRTFTQLQLSRVLFNGKSLMHAVSYYNQLGDNIDEYAGGEGSADEDIYPGGDYTPGEVSGKFFVNLGSDFFSRPTSLGLVFRDSEDDDFGAIILENCYFRNHSIQITGQQTVVMENATLSANRVIPLPVE